VSAASVRKVRRRRRDDEIVVEQTRDLAAVAVILRDAGTSADSLDRPGTCFVMAFRGDQPVGIAAIETKVDAGLVESLWVVEAMRHRGIGAALVSAARAAAHTRGARRLFAFAGNTLGAYLQRFGFRPIARNEALDALTGMFATTYLRSHPDELARVSALVLDISQHGVIIR
jgi:N-acetylglutamate synthase-like GNAT family acetyltransferase